MVEDKGLRAFMDSRSNRPTVFLLQVPMPKVAVQD